MSEIMRPIPFGTLMDWILTEYARDGAIFGVHELYRHESGKTLPIFGEKLETPFGPAAGPHTQMAQNIVAAYAGGGRFFEVKTVQAMDGAELAKCIARPCILAEDEGYNVEWSTELYVPQAFGEYVKAWYALKLISREFGLGDPEGFVFNMSVGYDLAGIQSEKIDRYIEGMKDAAGSDVWAECVRWTEANLHRFSRVDADYVRSIPSRICTSITLSTLHGCPPDEIERIASYLIREKKLHTYVKCNPTLLGYDFARETLDAMGYDYIAFDDHHFREDLQYEDAVPMFRRLLALAAENGVEFGVKLTNTFPVEIRAKELPGEEMYMSGRSLCPLTLALAERLEKSFDGKLRISYSGGAEAFNVEGIFRCGIWPITMATTLLKTGGYNRMQQIARETAALPYAPFAGVDVPALSALAAAVRTDARHVKPIKIPKSRKLTGTRSPLTDCFLAGCEHACPIHQDIPTYLKLVGEGKYLEAMRVICEKNPLPHITGTICNHRCQGACARCAMDEAVHIRDMKLKAARGGFDAYLSEVRVRGRSEENIAVVGGGPAGMAAAFLAARAGAKVTIFEKRQSLGGVVRHVIPEFRISGEAVERDALLLEKLGVQVKYGMHVKTAATLLGYGYTHVILACGAEKHGELALSEGESLNVIDFLSAVRAGEAPALGKNVVVIGGGNTAMDAARLAKRQPGVEQVYVAYRRTRREMPADAEELELAVAEGVEFLELRAPVALRDGQFIYEIMELGAPDESGRRSPVSTGQVDAIPCDTVIASVGERVDGELLRGFDVALDKRGRPEGMAYGKVFVVGDARRGPATVVEAIADAAAAVEQILGVKSADAPLTGDAESYRPRHGDLLRSFGDYDAGRCLGCSLVCEACTEVCPNRANVAVKVPGMDKEQIVHVDRLCNECGNCAAFCPYGGEPYHDKLTLFSCGEDMDASPANSGFLPLGDGEYRFRFDGEEFCANLSDPRVPAGVVRTIAAVVQQYAYLLG